MVERAGDGVLVGPPHAIGIWPGCVLKSGSRHRDQAGRALLLVQGNRVYMGLRLVLQFDQQELVEGLLLHASLAQFGESARLKPGRSLVRFQDLARTCRNEFSDAPYQGFAPKGDCSDLGPTDRRVCGGCHPRKGHLSPSVGSQSWYQALGVRAFPISSMAEHLSLRGWFQVRSLDWGLAGRAVVLIY